jgi:dienelactone hydrolase
MKIRFAAALSVLALTGCGTSVTPADDKADDVAAAVCDTSDDLAYPSPEWSAREAANFAKLGDGPARQAQDPAYNQRWQEQAIANRLEYENRRLEDPNWSSGENACASWSSVCTGDPYRYPGVDPWYGTTGEVTPVNFYDAQGARLSARVWAPLNPSGKKLPGVVIINGSVQAPETLYWWAAQMLAENGYVVLTFDPRGQGRSDSATPGGERGTNINSTVFRTNLIDAVDFFYSTPGKPYPHNLPEAPGPTADGNAALTTAFNPYYERFDRDRFGVIGHSLGATGVSVVQGEQPWPGTMLNDNPIDAVVAWDSVSAGALDGVQVAPRAPMMGQSADYFLAPTPNSQPPDALAKSAGFLLWQDAGVPAFQVQIQGGAHYEWSLLPGFPTSDWVPGSDGGWGQPLARHYTLAWMDRWLKVKGEPGYDDADARLLDDAAWRERMSFYYVSSRDYPARDGKRRVLADIRKGC